MLRFYATLWSIFGLAVLITFVTGNLSMFSAVVLGFLSCTLIFMGIICVLPSTVAHPSAPAAEKREPKTQSPEEAREAQAFHVLKSA